MPVDQISDRPDSGVDKYGDSVFIPTDLIRGINRILKANPSLDIKQTIGSTTNRDDVQDIWADEVDLIAQIEGLELSKEDQHAFDQFKAIVADQQEHFVKKGTYIVFVDDNKPQDTSRFVRLGFTPRANY